MTKLSDIFYLNRASRYANPMFGNDRLPIVYGDLSDGIDGNWTLPCIDTVNWVYAFAGHEVLSAANGNTVTIYEDGMELTGGGVDYDFDELNDYEGLGNIAIIDMVNPKDNAVITATGKGKPTATGGATLTENIIDIVYDFLTVENDFTSALFESTAKSKASQIFSAQSYEAAGIILNDKEIWQIIIEMMASFLGSAYFNGSGELVLTIDDGTLSQYGQAGIIRKSETILIEAKQRLANIINQCPCNYAYNYVSGEFKQETDAAAHTDAASQGIYGVRKPNAPYQFYWCRDLTSVQTVQDIIVAKFKDPIYEIAIDVQNLAQAGIDQGDVFIRSVDSLYDSNEDLLLNQYWQAIGVKPDFQSNKIALRALQTNYFLTLAYLLDGSFEFDGDVLLGGDRDTTVF